MSGTPRGDIGLANRRPEIHRRDAAMTNFRFTSLAGIAFIIGATLPALGQDAKPSIPAKPGEWRYLNSDPMATRYSALDQITRDNFKDLKLAWRWKPAIGPAPSSLGGTAQGNGDPTFAMHRNT